MAQLTGVARREDQIVLCRGMILWGRHGRMRGQQNNRAIDTWPDVPLDVLPPREMVHLTYSYLTAYQCYGSSRV